MPNDRSDGRASAPVVVVLGSLHYDIMLEAPHRPVKGETVTGTCWYPKFGGKGGNQAVAAKMHGADVRLISATGTDNFAGYLDAQLRRVGVAADFVSRLEDIATGMSVAIQDSEGDYGAVIVSGANLKIPRETLEEPAVWDNAAVLLLQNEVPEYLNTIAATNARRLGMTVVHNAAPARAMSDQFLSLVHILIVNGVEAEALGSEPVHSLESAALAAEALSRRFGDVIVTAGGDGVAVSSKSGLIKIAAKSVNVVSTHGAGDVFCGVLCAELAADTELSAAVSIANNSAADHVAAG